MRMPKGAWMSRFINVSATEYRSVRDRMGAADIEEELMADEHSLESSSQPCMVAFRDPSVFRASRLWRSACPWASHLIELA